MSLGQFVLTHRDAQVGERCQTTERGNFLKGWGERGCKKERGKVESCRGKSYIYCFSVCYNLGPETNLTLRKPARILKKGDKFLNQGLGQNRLKKMGIVRPNTGCSQHEKKREKNRSKRVAIHAWTSLFMPCLPHEFAFLLQCLLSNEMRAISDIDTYSSQVSFIYVAQKPQILPERDPDCLPSSILRHVFHMIFKIPLTTQLQHKCL